MAGGRLGGMGRQHAFLGRLWQLDWQRQREQSSFGWLEYKHLGFLGGDY